MKKTILGILVLMVLFSGLTIAQDATKQKRSSDFTLIGPKQLAKELRDPNSQRLKSLMLFGLLGRALLPVEKWLNLDEKIILKFAALMQVDQESKEFLSAMFSPAGRGTDFEKAYLNKKFDPNQANREFEKFRRVFRKIIIIIKDNLDPSKPEHQQAIKEAPELLKKIDNPNLLIQRLSRYEAEYYKASYAFILIGLWAKNSASYSIDNNRLQKVLVADNAVEQALQKQVSNQELDKLLKNFKEKLEELIQYIEKLS